MTSSQSPPPSSSHAPRIKHDVFISFRGSDIRNNFLSHLVKALEHSEIDTYVDDKLKEGSELMSALSIAIEESQIALVIFSKDYASSRWCLQELAIIHERMMKYGQIVIPIFYNVDPSDVRHQKGSYGKAFARHERSIVGNMMNVEKWRAALKKIGHLLGFHSINFGIGGLLLNLRTSFFQCHYENVLVRHENHCMDNSRNAAKWRIVLNEVANLSGFHSKNFRTEAELIEVVVQRMLTRLNEIYPVDVEGLIGINTPIEDLLSLISCDQSDVRVVGIWGMGGIGKTTIAGALFNKLRSKYETCHFLVNVREQCERFGVIPVRDKLLSIVLEEKDLNIGFPDGVPAHVQRRLHRKRVLLVLDDVNSSNQVEHLVQIQKRLGPGSRIIVTTRDKDVILKEANEIYEVKALGSGDALNLLKMHAFDEKFPLMNCHDCVMMEVVEYAKGIPLALKVLGRCLYKKSVQQWKSQMQKLQNMPFAEIQNILRLSYEGLDRKDKEIFLYIACFFHGEDALKYINNLLDKCGYSTAIALRTLHDKALITVCNIWEKVSVHDLIREMGREIARERNIEKPGKRNHLWDPNDICHVLNHDKGTDHIKSISMNMSTIQDVSISNSHCFARMDNLDLLRFYRESYNGKSLISLPKGLSTLPKKIKLFHWDAYPLKSLPTMWNAENLVELHMAFSSVEKLWDGVQNLVNLQHVELSGSEQLIELPDLSKASSLKQLLLAGCVNLLYIPSIFALPELVFVYLGGCGKLEELPDIEEGAMSSSSVMWHSNLKNLSLNGCESLKYIPDSLSKLTSLETLSLDWCEELNISNLHILFDGLSSLKSLSMSRCSKLNELPDNVSNLSLLEFLQLEGSNVKRLPESIKHLSHLRDLIINRCKRLQSVPEIPPSLCRLYANGCSSLERVFSPTLLLVQQRFQLIQNHALDDPYTSFSFQECPKLDKQGVDAILAYQESCNKRWKEIFNMENGSETE